MGRLAVRVVSPDGPVGCWAVWLHGFMGRGADGLPLARYMAQHGVGVILPDLPGHGASVRLPASAYTMDGAARLVAQAAAEGTGGDAAHLVGYSMGGRLALFAALHQPERWRSLLLESASPGLADADARASRRALDAERAAAFARDPAAFLAAWYRMPLFARLDEATRARSERRRAVNDPDELARSLGGMGTGAQPSLWEALPTVAVPTLALAGAADAKFVVLASAMAKAGPLRAAIVPHAGHAVHLERLERLARIAAAWIARHP